MPGSSIVRTGLVVNVNNPGYYTYGAYSGYRFGYSITRVYYWPVAYVHYGYPYRYYHSDKYYYYKGENPATPSHVVISDKYSKKSKTINNELLI